MSGNVESCWVMVSKSMSASGVPSCPSIAACSSVWSMRAVPSIVMFRSARSGE
jgi:hypothetical protein